MQAINKNRFDALAGYTRQPQIFALVQEAGWFQIAGDRLLGLVVWDRIDYDYGWIVLGRDANGRFRAIAQNASLSNYNVARDALEKAMEQHARLPDVDYYQGDEIGKPVDFFKLRIESNRLHSSFKVLINEPRYSPAREVIAAMMPYYEDADGNFIEQFQTTGFDARLWELYLYAAFIELGYAKMNEAKVPDLVLEGLQGRIAIEATTANPPQGLSVPKPTNDEEIRLYLENYIPIKLARTLKRKLYRGKRYWNASEVKDVPFVIALQDFHAPAAMTKIVPIATEYVFGVRHTIEGKEHRIESLVEHVYGSMREPSGFFNLPEAENVSAILLNPLGTLTKFNRLGFVAGFGDQRIRMVRTGLARGEGDQNDPRPKAFSQEVDDEYREDWIEGAVILHNPNARIPLAPNLIAGANHEFLEPDGMIMSLLPEFQPWMSRTSITLDDKTMKVVEKS